MDSIKLNQFKKYVDSILNFIAWNPTDLQLKKIAQKLAELPEPSSISDIQSIISQVCPGARFMVSEEVDNSDIKTLLAWAIAATKEET